MTKPIIGITTNVRANPAHEDINWSYAPSGFVEGVQKAGGLAILLPVSDPSEAKTYISMIDKLILIGGQNIDPKFYNEENHACEDDFFLERDLFEMALIEEATKQKKPIFSICRGTQLMNVALVVVFIKILKGTGRISLPITFTTKLLSTKTVS